MNEINALREQIDFWYAVGVAAIVFVLGCIVWAVLRYRLNDWENQFWRMNDLRVDEKLKFQSFREKSKRKVTLGADGELLEVISDGERSEAVHVDFHDESPYKTPSPDSKIPFSTWIDEENDNEFWS